jgi:hypothetical protein
MGLDLGKGSNKIQFKIQEFKNFFAPVSIKNLFSQNLYLALQVSGFFEHSLIIFILKVQMQF